MIYVQQITFKQERMQNEIRNTGKFKPFQYIIQHSFTTVSTIKVPQHSPAFKLKSIQWKRRYEDLHEKLNHLDGCSEYVCSELDKDFIIQASIENEMSNGCMEHRTNLYGPIFLQSDFGFLLDGITNDNEVFQLHILTSKKVYQCIITFSANQVLIRNKIVSNGNQFSIPTNDILNCFLSRVNGIEVIIFPTLFLRIIVLKLFNQILSKGTYSDNNDPTMMKIFDPAEQNPKVRSNLRWKRFLLKLNNIKQQNARRMTMPSIQYTNNNLKMQLADNQHKKEFARYSEDNVGSTVISEKKTQELALKKSQIIDRSKNNEKNEKKNFNVLKSETDILENDNQYFTQFQNLIYQQEQPEMETIELNNSFQEFQKKSRSQKEIQKLQYVKAKKKQREAQNAHRRQLQGVLQELNDKKNDLLAINNKLKYELQMQKNQNYSLSINAAKAQLLELKAQYERLTQQMGRKSEDSRRVQYPITGSTKF